MAGLFRRRGAGRVDTGMSEDRFWRLVEASASPQALHARLAALGDGDLAAFERRHVDLHAQAYDWGLWGAAYVLHGGCSDDTFSDFRSYLISRGRTVYRAALADPDSLADVPLDAGGETWEDWASPASQVVHERHGSGASAGPLPAHPAEPTGEEWDEDGDELARRFPRLTAAHGHP